jgi:hypothetical protein
VLPVVLEKIGRKQAKATVGNQKQTGRAAGNPASGHVYGNGA